jgi:hypothetical protein
VSCAKIGPVTTIFLGANDFIPYFTYVALGQPHVMLLRITSFVNIDEESHASLQGENNNLPVFSKIFFLSSIKFGVWCDRKM